MKCNNSPQTRDYVNLKQFNYSKKTYLWTSIHRYVKVNVISLDDSPDTKTPIYDDFIKLEVVRDSKEFVSMRRSEVFGGRSVRAPRAQGIEIKKIVFALRWSMYNNGRCFAVAI